MSPIGEKLAQIRKQQGFTQARLAEQAGISTSAIAMYETNRRQPDAETLSAIAKALGVSVSELQDSAAAPLQAGSSAHIGIYTKAAAGQTDGGASGAFPESLAEEGTNLTNLALTRDEARVILFIRMHPDTMPFLQNFMSADSVKRKQLEKAWRLIQAFQSS
ncbi:helix-turn-helix domain-containing protein [Alicyclobacillus acidiphilus]|uniref:helix-turn-helix domain-containing protein n=1 Tax=Alicyclobacillus acidiphilus TaxID=182455 RepID=UPI000835CA6D|nr:helix-turn-helix transcriptional regulator [Alicyclobacillus acidiphilus]